MSSAQQEPHPTCLPWIKWCFHWDLTNTHLVRAIEDCLQLRQASILSISSKIAWDFHRPFIIDQVLRPVNPLLSLLPLTGTVLCRPYSLSPSPGRWWQVSSLSLYKGSDQQGEVPCSRAKQHLTRWNLDLTRSVCSELEGENQSPGNAWEPWAKTPQNTRARHLLAQTSPPC